MRNSIKIVFINIFFIFFSIILLDNLIDFFNKKPKLISTFFDMRHSSNIDIIESPSLYYKQISNDNLYLKPVRFRTSNDLGDVLPRGGNGLCKLYFLGGSTTESHWMPEKKRWVYLVGENLNEEIKTYNFGVGGYNLLQNSLKVRSFLLKEDFDTLVLMNQINDISKFIQSNFSSKFYYSEPNTLHGVYTRKYEENTLQRIVLISKKLIPNTYGIWRYFRNRNSITKTRAQNRAFVSNNSHLFREKFRDIFIPQFISIIKNISDFLEVHNKNLIIIIQPNLLNNLLNEESKGYSRDVSHLISQLSNMNINLQDLNWSLKELRSQIINIKSKNIILIKDSVIIETEEDNFYDFIHYSPKGSIQLSKILTVELEKLIISKKICKQEN